MKNSHLLILLLIATLVSCGKKTAFDYSQAVVKMETELSADIANVDEQLQYYLRSDQKDSAIIMSRRMETLAESKLKEITNLKAPEAKAAEDFKKAAISYFTYIRKIYSSFTKFTSAKSEEQQRTEGSKLGKLIAEKKQVTQHMQEAQRRFAEANDFRIENTNTH